MLIELLTKQYPGMRLWLSQRLTAVVMAIYIVFLIVYMTALQPNNHEAFRACFNPFWFRVLTLFFFLSLCMHAWLGVRDVLKDYVFNQNIRGYAQMVVDILLIIYAIWISVILIRI